MLRRFLPLLAVFLACTKDPRIEERSIVVYSSKSCPVSQESAYSVMYAAGDFEPPDDRPAAASLYLRETGRVMEEFPSSTRALLVDVSQGDVDWRGYRDDVPRQGPINVLVWPGGESCRLNGDVERRIDSTLGVFGRHFLVAGGKLVDGAQVPRTWIGNLSTGIVDRLALGLGVRRSRATITEFPDPDVVAVGDMGALVAGGEDPDSGKPIDSAEVYLPSIAGEGNGDFDRTRIGLSIGRTQHGAAVLATGETLLVGGLDSSNTVTRSMEIVDPKTRRSKIDGVAFLAVPRRNPTVMRLASGEILVAGGLDLNGKPVSTLEWFAADASRATKRPVDLVTGKERAFVPLDAGGALAVIIPEQATPDFKTVWLISADGTLAPAVAIDPNELATVKLFAGAESSPALWTGFRWMRWQPWFGAFQTIADAENDPDPKIHDRQPSTGPMANGDSGLALWLDDEGSAGSYVRGFRFSARSRYAVVPKPLLVDGPGQLAPDRLAGVAGSSIKFDPAKGVLMGTGASAFLTDVTFLDFVLDVDVPDGTAPPVVVLREADGHELEVGGAGCAFGQSAHKHVSVRRSGGGVFVRSDDGDERTCPTTLSETSRVSIGLRGGDQSVSGARNLAVTRK